MAANQDMVEGSSSVSKKMFLKPAEPQFCKVVAFPFDQGLEIPDDFMRKYGRDLKESHVTLKVQTGESWEVELNHHGNGSRLEKGWKEFAEYFFMEQFFFVVFKYKGNSVFQVLIFDLSTVEIDYPVQINESDSEEETFVENLETSPTIRATKRSKNSEIEPNLRPKTRSTEFKNVDEVQPDPSRKETSNLNEKSDGSKLKMKKKVGRAKGSKKKKLSSPIIISNHAKEIKKQESEAYKKAQAFSLRSPHPNFIYIVQPSTLSPRFALNIPLGFLPDYITSMKDCKFTLHIPDKCRKWRAILRISKRRVIGQTGWKEFAEDNRFKISDVCVFELVKDTRKFYITVFPQN